jgi:hypothetical protein
VLERKLQRALLSVPPSPRGEHTELSYVSGEEAPPRPLKGKQEARQMQFTGECLREDSRRP